MQRAGHIVSAALHANLLVCADYRNIWRRIVFVLY